MRSIVLTLILGGCLCSCGSSPQQRGNHGVLQDQSLRLQALQEEDGLALLLFSRQGDNSQPVASLRGVRLVLATSSKAIWLPFERLQRRDQSLTAHCISHPDHQIQVEFQLAGNGSMQVQVSDQIALRSQVLELTLDYHLESWDHIDQCYLPHLQPDPGHVVADTSFTNPLAFLRQDKLALALLPDHQLLARERPIPQAIEFDLQPTPRLRHGLIAHQTQRDRKNRQRPTAVYFGREGAKAVVVQGETLRFAHELRILAQANSQSLGSIFRELWQRFATSEISGATAWLLDWDLDQCTEQILDTAIHNQWVDLSSRSEQQGTFVSDAATDPQARFHTKHQTLRSAYALDLYGERNGKDDLRSKAEQMLELALQAPRKGGLLPNNLDIREAGQSRTWELKAPASGFRNHYHSMDVASTSYWMLQLARRHTQYLPRALEASAITARFLLKNQLPDGAFPSWFESEFLSPKADALYTNSAETGAVALFLAEYGELAEDEEVLAASHKAMQFVATKILPQSRWLDNESYLSRGRRGLYDPRTGQYRQGSLGLIYSCLAALKLSENSAGQAMPNLSKDLLAELFRFQQMWSPPWIQDARVGGFGVTNADARWNDARQGLAAMAFFKGYQELGDWQLLSRGVAALRSAFASLPLESTDATGGTNLTASLAWGGGTACASAEIARRDLGQGIVDLAQGRAQGIDSLWFEDLQIRGQQASFLLLCHMPFKQPARISFSNLGDESLRWDLRANGESLGSFSGKELRAGIQVWPKQVQSLAFTPPLQLRPGSIWRPRVRIAGKIEDKFQALLEVLAPGQSFAEQIPLYLNAKTGVLEAREPYRCSPEATLGSPLRCRLIVTSDLRNFSIPAQGYYSTNIESMDAIDPGEGDELALLEDNSSSIRRFANGREFGRHVQGEGSFTYAIPVPRVASSLDLLIRLHGKAKIQVADQTIHEDDPSSEDQIRELKIPLSDRRLWESGLLPLSFTAADANNSIGTDIALIQFRSSGEVAISRGLGKKRELRSPDSSLKILLQPIQLTDQALSRGAETFRQAFFGGPEYRVTPDPESRRSSGSVEQLFQHISGGTTSLQGKVLPPIRWDALQQDLNTDAAEVWKKRVTPILMDHRSETPDIMLLLFGGSLSPTLPPLQLGKTKVIALPENEEDGSLLSCGRSLAAILHAAYQVQDLDHPAYGNFGSLALMTKPYSHLPAIPTSINLAKAGWADRLELARIGQNKVTISPLLKERIGHVLDCSAAPGRGKIHMQVPGMTWLEDQPENGSALLFWQWDSPIGLLRDQHGNGCHPLLLRLSPTLSWAETPFQPGRDIDLFHKPVSQIRCTTLQGEEFWDLRNLNPQDGGNVELEIAYLPVDLLNAGQLTWRTGSFDPDLPASEKHWAPLALDDRDRGVGRVAQDKLRTLIQPRSEQFGAIDGKMLIPQGALRVFGHVQEVRGEVRLSFLHGEKVLLARDLNFADSNRHFEFDISSHANISSLRILVQNLSTQDKSHLILDKCLAAPRPTSVQPVLITEAEQQTSVLLMDGDIYGKTRALPATGNFPRTLRSPVVLPKGPMLLRLRCGTSTATALPVKLTISLTDARGNLRHLCLPTQDIGGEGSTDLLFSIMQLPAADSERVDFLNIEWQGPTALHLVNFELLRP